MKTKNLFALVAIIGLSSSLLLTSCEKDDEPEKKCPKTLWN